MTRVPSYGYKQVSIHFLLIQFKFGQATETYRFFKIILMLTCLLQCLEHPWLLEQDIGYSVIKTDNLRKFLARRRWQRCGQAIRAMKRMSGEELSKSSFFQRHYNL